MATKERVRVLIDLQHATSLRERGERERRAGNRSAAIATYTEAVSILRTCDAPLKLAHTVRHLADLHRETGDRDGAARGYDEALAIYRAHADTPPLDLANAIRGYAVLTNKANLWREALELYRQTNVLPGVAESAGRLAVLAWRSGDAAAARRLLADAIAAAEKCESELPMEKLAEARALIR